MAFRPLTEMSRLETIYVHVPIEATNEATGTTIDPTGDVVKMTFATTPKLPDTPTWYTADWIVDLSDPTNPVYLARALVGPAAGVVTLTAAPRWWAFAKVVDNPQIPMPRASKPFRVH